MIALGIIISAYLTIVKYSPDLLACPNAGVVNCGNVITSQYSVVLGIPTSVLGMIFFVLGLYMLFRKSDTMEFLWSIAGIGAVIYSFTTQALLGFVCLYCLSLDAVIIIALLVVNFWKAKV